MKRLVIKSAVYAGLQVALLSACASENLQSTGLGPATTVPGDQPNLQGGPAVNPNDTPTPSTQTPAAGGSSGEATPNVTLPLNPGPTGANPPPAMVDDEGDEDETDPDVPPAVVAPLTPAQVGGELEGYLHLAPCQSEDFGHDCTLPGCQGGRKLVEDTIQLGGDPATVYDITVHVYGVVETRVYQGGERRAGNNYVRTDVDLWHMGGVVPANPGTYNSYELHVQPPINGAPNDYFINSRTGNDDQSIVRIDFVATFPVQGGGTILWRSTDANCRQITNCDDNECGPLEPHPLSLPAVSNANPPPPATFIQPYQTGANVGRGQWVYFDVTNVVPRP